MTDTTLAAILGFLPYLGAGLALGVVYFLVLYKSVRLHTADASAGRMIGLFLLRVALALAVFYPFARIGAGPLLAALVGFMIARFAVQGFIRRLERGTGA
ncbi:hypothetical protein HH303_18795 [Rhodospirillaceae bacterium KN72]|uniref:ATP synthase subunit I n=1 Tax=Pacificispira spongiicola TaxID=2729598 RepID=A0A7Y0E539_9PROT|nr:ATP synthase subunit I [Pacificispira spongiicola]NMM46546.1 hypothetical protein [Pacificispira spongiicola]